MLIREAKALLTSMLADAGVTPSAVTTADVLTTVEVFRRFAAILADDAALLGEDGDAILPSSERMTSAVSVGSRLISRGGP